MSRVRDESGFTLIEVMVAMVLGLIMLGAVLTVFESFLRQNRATELRADAQERARVVTDDLARNLRNQVGLAGGSATQFDRTAEYDLIFRTFDRNPAAGNTAGLSRVRYCLDSTNPASGTFFRQTQTWNTAGVPAMPTATACPGAGWTGTVELAEGVTNRRDGLNRPVWSFGTSIDGATSTVTSINSSLWMRVDPSRAGSEVHLTTAVALRNANRPPAAAFTVTKQGGTVILNAAPSSDPEGEPLRYAWTLNGVSIGATQRLEWPVPTGNHTVVLTVTDSGNTTASFSQPVAIS